MLLSALEHLETWKMSNTPFITTFTPLFPPKRPFFLLLGKYFCFWGLDWANMSMYDIKMLSNMLLSAPKPLKPQGMSNTPLLRPFSPLYAPFYCFGGLDWTNILKLKVIAFQNAIIHASICSRTLWDWNEQALYSKRLHCAVPPCLKPLCAVPIFKFWFLCLI